MNFLWFIAFHFVCMCIINKRQKTVQFPSAVLFSFTRSKSYMMHILPEWSARGTVKDVGPSPPLSCTQLAVLWVWQCRLSFVECRLLPATTINGIPTCLAACRLTGNFKNFNSQKFTGMRPFTCTRYVLVCPFVGNPVGSLSPLSLSVRLSTCRFSAGVHVLPSGP